MHLLARGSAWAREALQFCTDLMVLADLLSGQRVARRRHGGLPEGHQHPHQDGQTEEQAAALHLTPRDRPL